MNKVLVIGESCVDVFVYGISERKSPEGNGPVFLPKSEVYNDGMAYNVSNNLAAMGIDVDIITNTEEIVKRRYVNLETNDLYLRVDEHDKVRRFNISELPLYIKDYSAILISDYDKGFLSEGDIEYISTLHPLVIIDTKKKLGLWCRNIKFIKLNRLENKNNKEYIKENKHWLKEKLLITKDKDGVDWNGKNFPSLADNVVDVSGAGDTFIAGFVSEFLKTNNVDKSIFFANKAAANVLSKKGVSVYSE
jgi:D-beta-D-heptose 7-phosphate kinase/D-beta-D-heptose 1-phosphate adenosyltransferase